ncbi:MAG: nitroreductase family protein [Planctomycetes bacterium]|nr:nitroreductase family protein [Planctomycetota bacterium]
MSTTRIRKSTRMIVRSESTRGSARILPRATRAPSFEEIVRERYAARRFDGRPITRKQLGELLELIRLAPTSFNLQPWRARIVEDAALKAKLAPLSFNQAQVTTASHLLVFCANTDFEALTGQLRRGMLAHGAPSERVVELLGNMRAALFGLDAAQRLAWAQRQVYLALAHGLLGAQALGFDACPVDEFDATGYEQALKLPPHLVPTVVLAVGQAERTASEREREKYRYELQDLFF